MMSIVRSLGHLTVALLLGLALVLLFGCRKDESAENSKKDESTVSGDVLSQNGFLGMWTLQGVRIGTLDLTPQVDVKDAIPKMLSVHSQSLSPSHRNYVVRYYLTMATVFQNAMNGSVTTTIEIKKDGTYIKRSGSLTFQGKYTKDGQVLTIKQEDLAGKLMEYFTVRLDGETLLLMQDISLVHELALQQLSDPAPELISQEQALIRVLKLAPVQFTYNRS